MLGAAARGARTHSLRCAGAGVELYESRKDWAGVGIELGVGGREEGNLPRPQVIVSQRQQGLVSCTTLSTTDSNATTQKSQGRSLCTSTGTRLSLSLSSRLGRRPRSLQLSSTSRRRRRGGRPCSRRQQGISRGTSCQDCRLAKEDGSPLLAPSPSHLNSPRNLSRRQNPPKPTVETSSPRRPPPAPPPRTQPSWSGSASRRKRWGRRPRRARRGRTWRGRRTGSTLLRITSGGRRRWRARGGGPTSASLVRSWLVGPVRGVGS